jgi:uncharacterized protein YbjT (DUF2867 family)
VAPLTTTTVQPSCVRDAMDPRIVTVFGATGFLGRRIVWRLHRRGCFVRIASRHPDRGRDLFGTDPRLEAIAGDIRDTRSVIDAVTGAYGVVNAISLYIERGTETFHTMHVDCAERRRRGDRPDSAAI